MELKVRAVETEEKSQQEIEKVLLEKHEQEQEVVSETTPQVEETQAVEAETPTQETPKSELSDDDVLSYIKNRYDKQIDSVDQLLAERQEAEELPEDVSAYLKYKKETGRGFNDYVSLNKDYDEMKPDQILREYLVATERGLDDEDIDTLMEAYSYDADLDDESAIKKIKLNKKKAIAKAKDHFESEKEKYRMPLESSGSSFSKEDQYKLEAYNQYIQESTSFEESLKKRKEIFQQQTNDVFGSEFKGFEFTLDENNKVTFSPGDASELKKAQSDATNFLKKFTDENGLIQDAAGYHRALALAMNPEKFAKFFYEQGKSVQADSTMRKMKNTDMSMRSAPEVTTKGGTQVKAMNPDSGRGLKIRSRNKT